MDLPDTHKGGKLHAYQLLCKVTVQREHDTPLEPDHLPQFYAVLHNALHAPDPVRVLCIPSYLRSVTTRAQPKSSITI